VYQIWTDFDAEAAAPEVPEEVNNGPLKTEYLDVIISDVRTRDKFSFSVQILNTEG
jgi:staphylococcal nuclease domain-containing protein 1